MSEFWDQFAVLAIGRAGGIFLSKPVGAFAGNLSILKLFIGIQDVHLVDMGCAPNTWTDPENLDWGGGQNHHLGAP